MVLMFYITSSLDLVDGDMKGLYLSKGVVGTS